MAEEPLTNQPLDIPKDDRISNVANLPSDFDPTDPTQVNAEWIMNMFDKLVNGNYNVRPFAIYNSVENLPTTFLNKDNEECAMPKGACAYVLEEGYERTFFIFNGTTWTQVLGGKCSLQVTCSYNDDVLKGVAVVVDSNTIITKNNGLATFTGLNNGTTQIVASKDGFATNTSSKNIENSFETADVEMQPITLTFTVTDEQNNSLAGATITLGEQTTTTDNNGQATFSQVLDGTYNFSVSLVEYDTTTGIIVIDRQNVTQTVIMYIAPVDCYAVEAVTLDDAVKVNAGVGDSSTDYDVYASNTAITNILTLDGLARSSASAGEIASVRITKNDAQITVVADQDGADIQFNNDNEINEVSINVVVKDIYLAFTQSNKIIYFKNNTLPFIPSENTFESKSYTYYTYENNIMITHTAATSSVTSGGANRYNGITLNIDTSDSFSNGIWTKDETKDIEIDDNSATITTSSYLTDINPIIPRTNNFIFSCAKLNPAQWDTKLIIGGQVKQFIDNQEFYVKANQLIEIYATKHNSTDMKDTYNKYFYISNDKHYKKVNFIISSSEANTTFKFTINGVEFEYTGSTANIDCYEGETITWELSKTGFITQTGSYTVPSYPTIKTYDAGTKTLTKLKNAQIVGTLTENNGVFSAFAQNNYIKLNTITPTTDFDFVIKCNTGSSFGDLLRTQPDGTGILLRCSNSLVNCYLSSTGSGWNVLSNFNTGITMAANTDMYIKISWHNGTYTFYQSSDGTNWIERNSSNSELNAPYWSNNTQTIGGCDTYTEHWSGSVDMKETYIDIDGNTIDFWINN